VVGHLVVDRALWVLVELVPRLPALVGPLGQRPEPAVAGQPVLPAALVHHHAVAQGHRGEDPGAETHVDQVVDVVRAHLEGHVGARPGAVRLYPGDQPGHREAEPLGYRGEQQGVLVAVPAAPAPHQLVGDRLQPQPAMRAEQHVHVLERDGPHVRLV
jgi:hypothetical protein